MPRIQPVDPKFGPPKGVNNTYSNATLEDLRIWIAKDPLCQLFIRQKAETLERKLTELKVKRILEKRRAKVAAKRGERLKPHNRQRGRN